jgi:membrane protein YdbS with pleckstrin-like domain
MANVVRQLAEDEELVYHLHPHWRRLVLPFLAVPAVAAATTYAWLVGPARPAFRDLVLAVALALVLVVSARPYLRWRSTHYVVTSRRVLGRAGLVRHVGHEVPLHSIAGVWVENRLPGRLTRSGDLVLEDADEEEQLRLVDVPRVAAVRQSIAERLAERSLSVPD